jgi:hypothetical protein
MIPPVRELVAALAFVSRRFGVGISVDDEDLIDLFVDIRLEAQRLSLACDDEVAALFHASCARSPVLGEDFILSTILVTYNHGLTSGRRPPEDARSLHRELRLKAREISGGVLPFPACCDWLSARFPSER